ncbi:MAG: tRNA (adenosine(37)-N6)-threonylcarbamoyltransferase complex ATPase subunit type 1 TsaE, partial [Clostridia bacterium]
HFDLYRLSGADELFDIGFYEYLERGGICVMEWLSRADGEVAPDIIVTLSYDDDENTRLIEIEKEAK